jgi:hypothetical protein
MRAWVCVYLVFCAALVTPRPARAQGALEYAHGIAALQRGDFQAAREACAQAARALESQGEHRQPLGRAQLCVADALVGLGLRARARALMRFTVENLTDGGATIPRYAADLERARALQVELAQGVAELVVELVPADLCSRPRELSLLLDGERIDATTACAGRKLEVDPGPRRFTLAADGYIETTVETTAAVGAIAHARIVAPRDPQSPRWIRLAIHEEGAAVDLEGREVCTAPCGELVEAETVLRDQLQVRDSEGAHPVERAGGGLPRAAVLERVSDSNLVGWISLASIPVWIGLGFGGIALAAATDSLALALVGFGVTTLIIPAAIVGLIDVLTPPAPTYYALEPEAR